MRRKTTRVYRVGVNRYVNIEKEYEMKYGANLYYVWEGITKHIPCSPLGKFSSLAEALAFVRGLKETK